MQYKSNFLFLVNYMYRHFAGWWSTSQLSLQTLPWQRHCSWRSIFHGRQCHL